MTIATGYSGCTKEDIMNMPEDELRKAVLPKLVNIRSNNSCPYDASGRPKID